MKNKCTLTDEELVAKIFKTVSKLCETGGKSWTLKVPVDFNEDPDMLIIELCHRFAGKKNKTEN